MFVRRGSIYKDCFNFVILFLFLFFGITFSRADIIINVLAVNGKNQVVEKTIETSLPGEVKPEDILDAAGLSVEYKVSDAGYFLTGKVLLQPKESKTLRVRIRDPWKITPDQVAVIRQEIDEGFRELGAERSRENGELLKKNLLLSLDRILSDQDQTVDNINQRIDAYRNNLQTLNDVRTKSKAIDYWRSDAMDDEQRKNINYGIEVQNPSDKSRSIKQQHYLPPEVRPEYVVDRQGYEIRFDEKKQQPFLFKEESFSAKEKKVVKIGIKDVWFVHQKDMLFVRERASTIYETLKPGKFVSTAKALYDEIINNLDLIDVLQASEQPGIQQHIGVYRINKKRYDKALDNLNDLEKLLARYRADLEKSKIKNVMQKMQAMKSLARVSQAIFDKKPTINAAWKLIGAVMMILAFLTVIYFVMWFIRSGKEKKQEEIKLGAEQASEKTE